MTGLNVNKHTVYTINNFRYKNFIDLTEDEIRMVWEWRNAPEVRLSMYNKDGIPYDSHVKYIENLKNRDDRYYWLVYKNEEALGVIDLVDVDESRTKAEFGYYLQPESQNSGEGLNFVYATFKLFFQLGIEILESSVNIENKKAIVIDKYFGCKFEDANIFELNGEKYIPFVLQKMVFLKKFKL